MAAAPEAASQQPAAPVGEDQQPKLKGSSVLAPGEDASAVLNEIAKRKDVLELEIASIKQELENVNGHIHSLDEASAGGAAGSGSNGNGNGVLKKSGLLSSDSGTPRSETPERTTDPEQDEKRKNNIQGRKKFNISPQKGIEFLVEKGLLENTVEAIAAFLKNDDQTLDKTAIGEYLGEGKTFNISVLKLFVEKQDFSNMIFEKALRKFLSAFRLPGEAQKIDRMMELFAQRFCINNPGVFASPDTAYVLAFSTIMLNTDLHNPSVKNKITKPGFIKNNRGINEGGDLPEKLLSEIYDNILKDEIKMDETNKNDISNSFFNPERDGYLVKQGGRIKTWKRRWFVLTGNCLYYFKDPADATPCGIIPLENLEVRSLDDSSTMDKKFKYRFQLFNSTYNDIKVTVKAAKTNADGKIIEGRHQSYLIASDSEDEKNDWIMKIKANMSKPPIYTLMQAKKEKVKAGQGDVQFRDSDEESITG